MLSDFNGFDFVLLAVFAGSTLISLFRGFFREALSLAAWIAGLWAAWQFGMPVSEQLVNWIKPEVPRLWLARLAILVAVLLACGLLGVLLRMVIVSTGLTGTDRALGMVFGGARGLLLAGVLIVLLEAAGFSETEWWSQSQLVPHAEPLTAMIRLAAENGLDLFDQFDIPEKPF